MASNNSTVNHSSHLEGSLNSATLHALYLRQITGPSWNFMTAFYVVVIVCALSTNSAVLVTFLCRKSLFTSFNIYLMNLLSANILSVVLQNIPDLFNHLYSGWWLSDSLCSTLIFGLYMLEAGVQNCHILIAVNRIWAVFWPYSYRTRHKKPVALLLCLVGWLHVCATILPGFVLDTLYYRSDPAIGGCNLNIGAQWVWSVVVQFIVYDLGLALMWIAFPVIWWKRRQAQKVSPNAPVTVRSLTGTVKATTHEDNEMVGEDEEEVTQNAQSKVGPVANPRGRKRSSKAFTILTVLTASVSVCWTPCRSVYTLLMFVPFSTVSPLVFNIAVALFSLQSFLDPILFVCALPDLREGFRAVFRLNF